MNRCDWESLLADARVQPKWTKGKMEALKKRILLAQKFPARNNRELTMKVLQQASLHGIEYVLSNVSSESRRLYRRACATSCNAFTRVCGKRDELWESYYDACFIESRRNRKLTMQRLPKKFWKEMDRAEREKMKRGIQKERLDDWL